MKKIILVLVITASSSLGFAKDRKPAQVAEKKISCVFSGTGSLDGSKVTINALQDTITLVGRSAVNIKFQVLGSPTQLEDKGQLAKTDCEPDLYDTTDIMKVSIPYQGKTSEGWLLCHTTGHGIYDGSRNCDKRPY